MGGLGLSAWALVSGSGCLMGSQAAQACSRLRWGMGGRQTSEPAGTPPPPAHTQSQVLLPPLNPVLDLVCVQNNFFLRLTRSITRRSRPRTCVHSIQLLPGCFARTACLLGGPAGRVPLSRPLPCHRRWCVCSRGHAQSWSLSALQPCRGLQRWPAGGVSTGQPEHTGAPAGEGGEWELVGRSFPPAAALPGRAWGEGGGSWAWGAGRGAR